MIDGCLLARISSCSCAFIEILKNLPTNDLSPWEQAHLPADLLLLARLDIDISCLYLR